MQYKEVFIPVKGELQEILAAELSQHGYESFTQEDNSMLAYIPADDFNETPLKETLETYAIPFADVKVTEPQNINWNEEWEKNYQPILIENKLYIRASFHPKMEGVREIVIDPKMSFGTGHHATTRLVALSMLKTDLKNRKVLDMGCGTGILAILAAMEGATDITAVDNFPTAVENSEENAVLNGIHGIKFLCGEIEVINHEQFDIILSNITRNINKSYLQHYSGMLNSGGIAILSGFFAEDADMITSEAIKCGFQRLDNIVQDQWTALTLIKL